MLIGTETLEEYFGYKGKRLETCLDRAGIRYKYGKNGVVTTDEAINASMGLLVLNPEKEESIL